MCQQSPLPTIKQRERYTCDARAMSVCCDVRKIKSGVKKRAEALSYSLLQKSVFHTKVLCSIFIIMRIHCERLNQQRELFLNHFLHDSL